jgi:AcrR family transcriptional regulator
VEESRAAARASARARILDAAVKLIAREGIHDVRIARIAMEAGVSASLLHYHFASRDSLLAEALEHSYELAGDIRIGGTEEPGSASERLRWMIDQCLPAPGSLHDDWMLWVELWLHAARRPELRPTAARLYARMHTWFKEAILAGEKSGEFTVAARDRTIDRLLALIDGYGIRALTEDPAMPIERARAEIWAALAPEIGLAAE